MVCFLSQSFGGFGFSFVLLFCWWSTIVGVLLGCLVSVYSGLFLGVLFQRNDFFWP